MVFDLDGTLISCRPKQMAALRAVSGISGNNISNVWQLKRDGLSTRDALLNIGVSAENADEIALRWVRVIETPYFLSFDNLLSGAAESLKLCRTRGFRTVILTARHSYRSVILQSNALRLNSMSDEILVVDPQDGVKRKAEELLRINACILIGDSEVDAQAASTAGVAFHAVSSGQRSFTFLQRKLGRDPFESVLPATLAVLNEGNCHEPINQSNASKDTKW